MRLFFGLCWTLLLSALGGPFGSVAYASPSYTRVLERSLDLDCEPACTVCHTDPEGGFATTNTKFGITLRRMFRAQCCDDAALEAIVPQLQASGVDSDEDGASDLEELQASTDPNSDEDAPLECREPASKGCSAASTSAQRSRGWPLLALVAAALLLRRRTPSA